MKDYIKAYGTIYVETENVLPSVENLMESMLILHYVVKNVDTVIIDDLMK